MEGGLRMGIRVLFGVFLGVFASLANATDTALPWSFVNGSAKGDSIQLVSAFPAPGTKLAVGQTVEFKINVSYQLSIADKGSPPARRRRSPLLPLPLPPACLPMP